MTSDPSKLPDQVLRVPVEARAALSSGDRVAAGLRGFGPLGILAILVILADNGVVVPLSAVLVLVWARRSRTPGREIGYVRPKRKLTHTTETECEAKHLNYTITQTMRKPPIQAGAIWGLLQAQKK